MLNNSFNCYKSRPIPRVSVPPCSTSLIVARDFQSCMGVDKIAPRSILNQVILALKETFIFDPRNNKQFKKLVSQLFLHIAP